MGFNRKPHSISGSVIYGFIQPMLNLNKGSSKVCEPALDVPRKPQGLSLGVNFSWNLSGNFVYGGCQWGLLVVLAKFTDPEMVGRFALGFAITAPIMMLCNLQLSGLQAVDARGEFSFAHYLGLRLITTTLALTAIVMVTLWADYSLHVALMVLLIGFAKAIESISDVYYGFMQRHERMDFIGKSRIFKAVLSIAVFFIIVYQTGQALWGVLGLSVAWALTLVFYDIPSAGRIMKHNRTNSQRAVPILNGLSVSFKSQPLLRLARMALPLGAVMGIMALQPNIPRYFIEHFLGERDLGIFSAMVYLSYLGIMIVAAMGQSSAPRLAYHYAAGNYKTFASLLLRLLLVALALGTLAIGVAVLGGRPLLAILYGPEYGAYADVWVWLMVAAALAFLASPLGYAMTAARYFNIQLPLHVLVTGCTASVAWTLIPQKGITGAALALLSGALVQLAGSAAVMWYAVYFKKRQLNLT
jgi:O-antigen/teichoic acid export membrane protein